MRFTDAAISEKELAAHPPIKIRPSRASCHVAKNTDGKNEISVLGEDKAALTLVRDTNAQSSRLMLNCGRALFRAQQAGAAEAEIPYRQFLLDDPKLPSDNFLVDAPRVSIEYDPFSQLGRVLVIDKKLPIAAVPLGLAEKFAKAIDDAKATGKPLALDWSHPIDPKNHPLVVIKETATSALTAPAVVTPASAN